MQKPWISDDRKISEKKESWHFEKLLILVWANNFKALVNISSASVTSTCTQDLDLVDEQE